MNIAEDHRKFKQRLREKHQRKHDIQELISEESQQFETELILPAFINNDYVLNPVFSLNLTIKETELKIEQEEDEIVSDTIRMINSLINSCNSFARPEFAKLFYISRQDFYRQEEEEQAMDKMTLAHDQDGAYIFGGQKRNIYSKFLGRIKIKESQNTEKDIIFNQDETQIFQQTYVKKYMKVAD